MPQTGPVETSSDSPQPSAPVATTGTDWHALSEQETLARLEGEGRVAFRYTDNPNGAAHDIAGVLSENRRVLGLMPHPENHIVAEQHPQRHHGPQSGLGLPLFYNGVRHAAGI